MEDLSPVLRDVLRYEALSYCCMRPEAIKVKEDLSPVFFDMLR
jgi:hypothetical protein